ncbi:MAG TPA: sulfatase-like hydrolase/transferase, partial [Candidatus Methanoperedens sp.]
LTFGTRIVDFKTPHPVTGTAHSVITTGYSEADEEIAGYPDATFYDAARKNGFVNLAIMEKGDFSNLREEQDIILFAQNNSIDEPVLSIKAKNPPAGVEKLMHEWEMKLPDYLNNKSGVEKYSAYNKWGIDAAESVLTFMIKNYPSQKFFLTINIGAIDSGGHNLGYDGYIRLIEDLDKDISSLYQTASSENIAFFFTSDHGMSFANENARRGGHASDKYASREESVRIPLSISSTNTVNAEITEEYGQADLASTILSVLDLPDDLQYADGRQMPVKIYASLFIKADREQKISLWNGDQKVSEQSASDLILAGLTLNNNYTLKAESLGRSFEKRISLDSDKRFILNDAETGMSAKEVFAMILILLVNIAGLLYIRRIR